jgi:hypothetical protein
MLGRMQTAVANMITALSEFVDFLFTRAATEIAQPPDGISADWHIRIRPPHDTFGPVVTLNVYLQSEKARMEWGGKYGHMVNCTCNFDSVERGHRVGPEELGVVADYYINKINSKLAKAWA